MDDIGKTLLRASATGLSASLVSAAVQGGSVRSRLGNIALDAFGSVIGNTFADWQANEAQPATSSSFYDPNRYKDLFGMKFATQDFKLDASPGPNDSPTPAPVGYPVFGSNPDIPMPPPAPAQSPTPAVAGANPADTSRFLLWQQTPNMDKYGIAYGDETSPQMRPAQGWGENMRGIYDAYRSGTIDLSTAVSLAWDNSQILPYAPEANRVTGPLGGADVSGFLSNAWNTLAIGTSQAILGGMRDSGLIGYLLNRSGAIDTGTAWLDGGRIDIDTGETRGANAFDKFNVGLMALSAGDSALTGLGAFTRVEPLSYDISRWGEYGLPSDGYFVRTLTRDQYRDFQAGRSFNFGGASVEGYPDGMGFIGSAEEVRGITMSADYREALKLGYEPRYVMEFQLRDPAGLQNVIQAPYTEFRYGGATGAVYSEWNYPGISSKDIVNSRVWVLE